MPWLPGFRLGNQGIANHRQIFKWFRSPLSLSEKGNPDLALSRMETF
jgi:hypothetical protein